MTAHRTTIKRPTVLAVATILSAAVLSACPKKSDTGPRAGGPSTARPEPARPRPPAEPPRPTTPFKPTWDVAAFKAGHVRVIHKRTPGKPVVAVRLYYQGGCENLTARNEGIEEMLLAVTEEGGSEKFPMDLLPAVLYSRGIQLHAAAGQDYSVLGLKCVRQHFPKAWEILTDLALKPSLAGPALKIQRARQLKAIQTRLDSPDQHVSISMEKFFFAGHPYQHLQIGNEANVKRFTDKDLKAYHRRLLAGDRLALVVVGDLDREDLKRRAVEAFGALPASTAPFRHRAVPVHAKSRLKVIPRDLPTNFVIGYFSAPSPGHPDYAPLKVGLSILSDTLFEEVRTKRRLSYAVSSGISVRRANVGYLYFSTRNPDAAVSVSIREMRRMIDRGVTREQLNDKLQVFLTHYLMGLQTHSAQAKLLARAVLLTGSWQWAERHLEDLRQVTAVRIQQAMKKYCRNLQFVVLGPTRVNRAVFTSL